MKLVAFDLETTGLKWEEGHRVMEFCFIELDAELKELGRWSRLVNPQRPIPEEVVELTSIADAMVADEPTFDHFAKRIQSLVEGATLIAHNHRFDIGFLHNELIKAGQPGLSPTHPAIDTVAVERYVNSHKLSACYERYVGEPFDGAHRSEADTAATVEVLRRQISTHGDKLPAGIDALEVNALRSHFNPGMTARQWLDHGHKFYVVEGETKFGFGKYQDQTVDRENAEHRGYLDWMLNRDFAADTVTVVKKLLADPQQKLA